jgi:hypothetical protein
MLVNWIVQAFFVYTQNQLNCQSGRTNFGVFHKSAMMLCLLILKLKMVMFDILCLNSVKWFKFCFYLGCGIKFQRSLLRIGDLVIGVEYHVCSSILSKRSEYFANILSGNWSVFEIRKLIMILKLTSISRLFSHYCPDYYS